MAVFSAQTEVGILRRAVVKRARDAFASDDTIERQWRALNYTGPPVPERAHRESDDFIAALERLGVAVDCLPRDQRTGLDGIYTRDASVVCRRGIVLCNMGKPARESEPAAQGEFFKSRGVPVIGAITGEGKLEGGDVVWLDAHTLAVGEGYRTNAEGIRQLHEILRADVEELIVVPLPHWRGPGDVFHLMSILSPIDHDLALVYSPLLPVRFRQALLARGVELVEVPDDELDTLACNVLAVGPRRCLALAGNTKTRARLEAAGAEVHEYVGAEISIKGGGGPTCLTRPLVREG